MSINPTPGSTRGQLSIHTVLIWLMALPFLIAFFGVLIVGAYFLLKVIF